MNEQIRNVLGIAVIITLLSTAYVGVSYVRSFASSIQPASFTVTGQGEIVAIPDVIQFSFSVLTEGGLVVGELQKENTAKMNSAIDFLKENGVAIEDLKTQNYNIEPRYSFCIRGVCSPSQILGYSVNQSVAVKVRDFDMIGDILSGIVQRGANSVSQLSFTIDDPSELEDRARNEAMDKAQLKAQDLARLGGFKVGKLISVSEGGFPIAFAVESFARDGISGGPSIEPGTQKVSINVTLRYEIR